MLVAGQLLIGFPLFAPFFLFIKLSDLVEKVNHMTMYNYRWSRKQWEKTIAWGWIRPFMFWGLRRSWKRCSESVWMHMSQTIGENGWAQYAVCKYDDSGVHLRRWCIDECDVPSFFWKSAFLLASTVSITSYGPGIRDWYTFSKVIHSICAVSRAGEKEETNSIFLLWLKKRSAFLIIS